MSVSLDRILEGSEFRLLARSGSPTSTHPDVPKISSFEVVLGDAAGSLRVIGSSHKGLRFVVPVAEEGEGIILQQLILAISNLRTLPR
jgi:hypothetical protein